MNITINNIEYNLKYTLRGLFIYEKINEEQFTEKKLMDYYLLFYSLLLANNEEFNMTFDELIGICDNDPNLFKDFLKFLNKEFEIQNQLSNKEVENKVSINSKKKVSRSKNCLD